MVNKSSKEKKVTVRCTEEDEQQLLRIMDKYKISQSECLKRGLYMFDAKNNYDILQSLCNISSVVNEMLEIGDFKEEDKIRLREEVNEIWQQLK